MGKKKRLLEMIEREREYYNSCPVGTEEYNASQERLKGLEKQLAELGDQASRTVIEGVKVAGGIALPIFGWVVITAFEKNDSLSTSLKKTIDCFIPSKRL